MKDKEGMEEKGTPTPLPESVQILKSVIPAVFDSVRSRFDSLGVSESTRDELTALIDINDTLNYWSGPHYEHNKKVVLGDLRAGKTAKEVRNAVYYSLSPNHKIMDDRYHNNYHNQKA